MANNKWKLVVKTNEYTGNFHREFNAFVFGSSDYGCHDWVIDLRNKADEELGKVIDEDKLSETFEYFYDEYGSNISELSHYIKDKGTTAITVHFAKDPTKYMPIFEERIKRFPTELAKCKSFAPKNVKILSIELVKETTTQESLWIKKV